MIGADASTSRILLDVAWLLLGVFLLLAVACVAALIGIRVRRRVLARQREQETVGLRVDLIAVVIGEEPDATDAARRLGALRGRLWERADELLVGMLPKVRGDAKGRVLAVLMDRGAEERALKQVDSRRAFARCRGAFALGAMGAADATARVIPLLSDRSPQVRRVAVRALGMMGDPAAADSLLDAANDAHAVQRDLVQALIQLGTPAAPVIRARVSHATMRPDGNDRSGPVAATALGLMDDVAAARDLATAVDRGPVPLQLAAAQALGHLDSPVGVPALERAVSSPSAQVQLAAATSLGRLGAATAVPALLQAVAQGDPIVARSAATALLILGPDGRAALASSPAAYAVEAVAIDAMRHTP
jgi:hypothetical protein